MARGAGSSTSRTSRRSRKPFSGGVEADKLRFKILVGVLEVAIEKRMPPAQVDALLATAGQHASLSESPNGIVTGEPSR